MRRTTAAILTAAAILLAYPASSPAIDLAVSQEIPLGDHGVINRTYHVDVAPGDDDDDGCRNARDDYRGPGCKPPPPPPAPVAEPAPEPVAPAPETVSTSSAPLDSIAACESGGDYGAVDSSGTYWGAYQFDAQTWASVSSAPYGSATPAEQDAAAAELYASQGAAPWPVCGQ